GAGIGGELFQPERVVALGVADIAARMRGAFLQEHRLHAALEKIIIECRRLLRFCLQTRYRSCSKQGRQRGGAQHTSRHSTLPLHNAWMVVERTNSTSGVGRDLASAAS